VSASLARTVALYAVAVALFCLGTAASGRGLQRPHAAAAVVLGAGAILDAVIALAAVAAGGRPREPVPFAGYLLLSTVLVPVSWANARGSRRGWDAATFGLATLALCVICVRLGRTWG
jgi:hypothetical protein